MTAGIRANMQVVDLHDHQIQSLVGATFPDNLQVLNLAFNRIQSLGNGIFPDNVQELELNSNEIQSLIGAIFPGNVQILRLNSNRIQSLANVIFPASITTLFLYNNQIHSLAGATFPANLQKLDLNFNQIHSLAGATFPANLQKLDLNFNQIQSLANVIFPDNVQEVELAENEIQSLVGAIFPGNVQILNLNSNRIQSLANVIFPTNMVSLSLNNNALENIDSVLQLPSTCMVEAEHNRFSAEYVASFQLRLAAIRRQNPLLGPTVHFSIEDSFINPIPNNIALSFLDQLRAWKEEIEASFTLFHEDYNQLQNLLNDDGKGLLSQYLGKLREVKDYKEGGNSKNNIIRRAANMLNLACTNSEFLEKMIGTISEGLETCGDRVLITFNNIEILWHMHQDLTDEQAKALAIRAQCYFVLTKYADNLAERQGLGDHIETMLYFQIRLRETLQLPITTQGMLYPGCSGVTDEMLIEAKNTIERFSDAELLGASDFWLARMKKNDSSTKDKIDGFYTELLNDADEYNNTDKNNRSEFLKSHETKVVPSVKTKN